MTIGAHGLPVRMADSTSDDGSSPEYFPAVSDWKWGVLKAKEDELKAKEDALKAKEKEICDKQREVEDEAKRVTLKKKLITKEATLRAKEQEILEKTADLERMLKLKVGIKGEEKQSETSRDEIVQDVRDLKRVVTGWEQRERKKMMAEERG